ncbi:chromosome segregation protein SMC [Desulfonema ishimotonii]|uniref:Chromosome segregation protein SMC n=1 Tax=Desulfonema ishimotonii TaxID=45657 RepID=A0A401G4F6_9BACT|nr:chromosome segregation protein SMC [Desulfonema ishimotonii]GBC64128.1 chromosome segregation protein SMC [Desulfonema ishimotonii]
MKLKKMDITGFKSFCDRASIAFPAGISAIVGPNGCGKSNIVDALRWAMGEQSVKQLRGKSMEDVIFAGTNGRAPLNMAEVSLTLVNDNGTAPEELKDFTEIMLTRRLYRSGERSYFINKQPCRLKDIHNIFLGSGMGAKSYAVIQQGNIGAITDAGPEERRFFIEEAAGISRYKNRKKETLSKLEATNQNLLRVTDIISEVERQMNSLKRQALKAERFQKYQERKKHLDIRLAIHHYDQYSQEIQKNTYLLKELKDEDLAHATSLKKLDAAIEEIRLRRTRKNQEIADQRSGQFEIQRNIDRSENDLDHLKKEMNRLTTESKELQTAHITLQERNREILAEVADGESRNVGLRQETETVKALLTREQADSQGIRGKLADLNQALERAKSELTERVGQEARYKNIFQNVSSNKDNLRRRLKRADEDVVLAGQKVTECEKKEAEAQEEVRLCRDETEEIGEQIDAIRAGLGEKSKALGQQVKAVQTLEYDRNKVRSRYAALKKMADSFEWYRDGVKAVMKSEAMQDRISGVMADILEPEPGYAAAVEAVLGEALQYVIVSDRAAGQEAIGFLRSQNAGRGGFIPATGVRVPAHGQAANPDRLLAHVRVKPGFEEIAEALLGHAVVADSLSACAPDHCAVRVTRDGEVLTPRA